MRARDAKDREPRAVVDEATRVAWDAVFKAEKITAAQLKTLGAVTHLLSTFSRTWDYTSHRQISGIARISRRSIIRSIDALVRLGAIGWIAGGPGELSILRLPEVQDPRRMVKQLGVVTDVRHQAQRKVKAPKVKSLNGEPHELVDGTWVPVPDA